MSGFQHDIAGGNGNLVVTSVQSPNFVHDVSGWQITKSGNLEANSATIRGGEIIDGTTVSYTTSPGAANKLAYSESASPFTDDYGNHVLGGFTVYGTGGGTYWAVNIPNSATGGVINFYSGAASMAAWGVPLAITGGSGGLGLNGFVVTKDVSSGNVQIQAASVLEIDTAVEFLLGLTITADGLAVTGGTTTDTLAVDGTETVTVAASTTAAVNVLVSGDTAPRLHVVGSGALSWGPGNAAQDVNLRRVSAGVLQTDESLTVGAVLTATGGTVASPTLITTDTWNTMPAFATNYSHGTPAPAYKLNADNTVSFAGEVSVASGAAGATFVTLPASAYFPPSTKKFAVPFNAGTPATSGNCQVTISTSGGVTLSAVPTGAAFSFALDGIRYPLDY